MKEIAPRNINTLEAVNEQLPVILKEVNAALNNHTSDKNVLRTLPANYNFDTKFATNVIRKMSRNNKISNGGCDYVLVHPKLGVLKKRAKSEIKLYINYKSEAFHINSNQNMSLLLQLKK